MQSHTQKIDTRLASSSKPDNLGKYEIVDAIGEGGFGIVYKGFDPFIKRHVAIKTCTSPDHELRQRYFREAEIAGRLDHPNIVRIFDFGIEDDTPYLVQEFLPGCDLDHKIDGREFVPYPERLLYLIHIARGLEYAHRQSVIHRDVKPANIRILEDGSAKIMDFGVAMLQHSDTRLTKDGLAVGTASYLAPEQVQARPTDKRTDIFSYGVLAYELLTGERPFERESISATLFSIVHDDPRPITLPSRLCPQALRRLIDRCLDKDPEKRYPGFSAILADLDRIRRQKRTADQERDFAGELQRRAPSSSTAAGPARPTDTESASFRSRGTSTGFDPRIRHEWTPSSIRVRRRNRWLALVMPVAVASLLGGFYAFLVGRGLAPWPGAAAPGPELSQGLPGPRVQQGAAPETADPAVTAEKAAGSPSLDSKSAPTAQVRPPVAQDGASTQSVPVQDTTTSTPTPSNAVADATLTLARSWHSAMTVSIGNGETLSLARSSSHRLQPGDHTLTFSLATAEYRATETLRIQLTPGEERQIGSPIGRPGRLSVQARLGSPQGVVRVDGKALGSSPVRGLPLLSGRHRLQVFSANDSRRVLADTPVDIRSSRETVITFDLTGRHQLAVRHRNLHP